MNPYVRPTDTTPISRRSVIVNAGLAAFALTGLASCSSYSSEGTTASAAPAPAPASGGAGVTAKTAEIPVGGGKIFADAQTVVTQPAKGEVKAFSSICTHAKCPVAEVTTTINCKCHGSEFALADGSVVKGPATAPLPAKTAKVEGDSVMVAA